MSVATTVTPLRNEVLSPTKVTNKEYKPDPDRVKAVETKIAEVRTGLLLKMPFWGQLACRLDIQDASGWCPTAATDGRVLYYNVDFVEKLSKNELKFLFAHEICHIAYDHFLRQDRRDAQLWNCAADYAINGELVDIRMGSMPDGGLLDSRYTKMYAEEIYDELQKDASKRPSEGNSFDVHLDAAGDDEGEGDGQYKKGDEWNKPTVGDGDRQEISDEMRNNIIQANEAAGDPCGSGAGTMPAGMRRLIKQWTEPQLDWREYLEVRVKSLIKDDWTFMNPSRRDYPGGIIMPGMKNADTIRVHISIDTSGSMGEQQLKDLMGEVAGIMEQFSEFEVHVWNFDAAVIEESYKVFTLDNLDEIYEYELHGGGGTDFMVNWDFMEDREIEPEIFLLFTDGYPCGDWGREGYCDTIYLVHNGDSGWSSDDYGHRPVAPDWAMTLYYEKKK